MTADQKARIDRVVLIVSSLDRAEEDYVRTFGCRVEQRGDIAPALARVLSVPGARGRRSLLRLGRKRIELLEFTARAGACIRPTAPALTCGSSTSRSW
jgi:catechol 2,3-dioxygenase-like lactoylglutathione lyase family enzyme